MAIISQQPWEPQTMANTIGGVWLTNQNLALQGAIAKQNFALALKELGLKDRQLNELIAQNKLASTEVARKAAIEDEETKARNVLTEMVSKGVRGLNMPVEPVSPYQAEEWGWGPAGQPEAVRTRQRADTLSALAALAARDKGAADLLQPSAIGPGYVGAPKIPGLFPDIEGQVTLGPLEQSFRKGREPFVNPTPRTALNTYLSPNESASGYIRGLELLGNNPMLKRELQPILDVFRKAIINAPTFSPTLTAPTGEGLIRPRNQQLKPPSERLDGELHPNGLLRWNKQRQLWEG